METPSPNLTLIERFNKWIRESIMLKLGSIGLLTLILLIPQKWIESLIEERQYRAGEVIHEIAEKWSNQQIVAGPVLVVPVMKHEKIDKGKDGIRIIDSIVNAYFLPEELTIDGKINPQILHRGIFESAVYESALKINARFIAPDFRRLNIPAEDILWKDAYLSMGISDLRGISDNPKLLVGDQQLKGEPSDNVGFSSITPSFNIESQGSSETYSGILVRLPWNAPEDFVPDISIDLHLKGSQLLYFAPVGKTTDVKLSAPWDTPAFDGQFLPSKREVTKDGFLAEWKILHFNRAFSQSWIGETQKIGGSEFGVRLLIPVDQYQKSIRTAKYGILVILLTFVSLFLVEIIRKIRIHPMQYILIASALIVYYVLLLSLSEHLGYNYAYLIATVATILLVTLYSKSFLPDNKTMGLFGSWMVMFYGFIFVIIQEQDYSLLLGSIGLFLIIGVIMYFSRKIRWYN